MGEDYTPTTEQVRDGYALDDDGSLINPTLTAAFDRWLVQHDREVRAQALRDAADHFTVGDILTTEAQAEFAAWLRARAYAEAAGRGDW